MYHNMGHSRTGITANESHMQEPIDEANSFKTYALKNQQFQRKIYVQYAKW